MNIQVTCTTELTDQLVYLRSRQYDPEMLLKSQYAPCLIHDLTIHVFR
jgi:hypothetical protein